MSTFTIDPDDNITALVEVPADADRSTTFSTEKELAKLVGEWPISRLIDAWNSFAGVAPFQELKPIKKFTDRKSAVADLGGHPATVPERCAIGARGGTGEGQGEEVPGQVAAARTCAPGRKRAHEQEGRGHRDDEAREGRDPGRNHRSDGLAEAHRARLREHPRQQGRREGRILEERRRRA
jgi:hypothetical protein